MRYLNVYFLRQNHNFYITLLTISMSTRNLPSAGCAILFLLLLCSIRNCRAQNRSLCLPSSCGNIRDISYPFRFKGDPWNCGKPDFELDCQNNHTIIHFKSKRYHVQTISYDNYTIRLVDPGLEQNNICSLPTYTVDYNDIPNNYNIFKPGKVVNEFIDLNTNIAFLNCQSPVSSPRYINTTFCSNTNSTVVFNSSRLYSYVILGNDITVSEFEESCSVEKVAWSSVRGPIAADSASFSGIHSGLTYGFELSWYNVLCEKCQGSHETCIVLENTVTCRHYCYEDTPFAEHSFRCRLEFWAPIYLAIGAIAIGCILGLRFLCGLFCLAGLVGYQWKRRHLSMDGNIEDILRTQSNLTPLRYTYSQIKKMTNNFKDRLGEGGCGTVFKGKLRSGTFVAVKMMSKSMASEQENINEVATLGRIHHINVVQIIGFCSEGSKRALVYEFMSNGSLEKYLFLKEDETMTLSYEKMFQISLGVARGIDYLHRGCDMQILHFDIMPHNILLDDNFNPKISDFGLAKLYPADDSVVSLTAARGTMGYMAPELFYKNIGGVSYKADVYSFGMLLMEMAGRRKNLNPFADSLSKIYFPSWVYDQFSEDKYVIIGDATEQERNMIKRMILVALWCIQMKPVDRPSMNKVVDMLDGDVEQLQMPPKPFLAPPELVEKGTDIP